MPDIDAYIQNLLQRKRSTRFKELQRLLFEVGFEMRQRKRGGSHYVFSHKEIDELIVLVTHGANDMLPEYQVVKAIKALRQLREKL